MEEIHNDFIMSDEMTPDEREWSYIEIWKDTQPDDGGSVCVLKYLSLDAAAVHTTVETLVAVRDAIALDAETHGLQNEWDHLEVPYLLKLFDLRMKSDAGLI